MVARRSPSLSASWAILAAVSEKRQVGRKDLGRKDLQGVLETRLALERARAGVSQADLAYVTGIPLTTYRRLERGKMPNPPIRYLTNIALALDVPLFDICEDGWLEWTAFSHKLDKVPAKESLHDVNKWAGQLPQEVWRPYGEPRRHETFVPERPPFRPVKPSKPTH